MVLHGEMMFSVSGVIRKMCLTSRYREKTQMLFRAVNISSAAVGQHVELWDMVTDWIARAGLGLMLPSCSLAGDRISDSNINYLGRNSEFHTKAFL